MGCSKSTPQEISHAKTMRYEPRSASADSSRHKLPLILESRLEVKALPKFAAQPKIASESHHATTTDRLTNLSHTNNQSSFGNLPGSSTPISQTKRLVDFPSNTSSMEETQIFNKAKVGRRGRTISIKVEGAVETGQSPLPDIGKSASRSKARINLLEVVRKNHGKLEMSKDEAKSRQSLDQENRPRLFHRGTLDEPSLSNLTAAFGRGSKLTIGETKTSLPALDQPEKLHKSSTPKDLEEISQISHIPSPINGNTDWDFPSFVRKNSRIGSLVHQGSELDFSMVLKQFERKESELKQPPRKISTKRLGESSVVTPAKREIDPRLAQSMRTNVLKELRARLAPRRESTKEPEKPRFPSIVEIKTPDLEPNGLPYPVREDSNLLRVPKTMKWRMPAPQTQGDFTVES